MSTSNNGPYSLPSQDPNQGYGQQGGYAQQQAYPKSVYSNAPGIHAIPLPAPESEQKLTGVANSQHGEASFTQPDEGPTQSDMYDTTYLEDPNVKGFEFSDKSIRRGFIRKVYSILMLQLLITAAVIAFFMFERSAQYFVEQYTWTLLVAVGVLLVAMIVLACCDELRRKAPANYIVLCVFTLAMAFLLGVAASTLKSEEILMAVGITAILCLGLTLFAFQTRFDFTFCGGFLFISLFMLLIFGLAASIMAGTGHGNKVGNTAYACVGALLFSLYLIYDTQLMMGGRHKYSISPEEYIFAALNLYLDVINIFLYVLRIVAGR